MDRTRNLMELPARPHDRGDSDHGREADALAARLGDAYPDLAPEMISALVDEAFTELRLARVQAFRSILAERSVRRQLRAVSKAHR